MHIFQEIITIVVNETLAGHNNKIFVELHKDNSVNVEDNGRGISIGIHPIEKISVIELIFTQLYVGGKFNSNFDAEYFFLRVTR